MRKLKLDVDMLLVESFSVASGTPRVGTVAARVADVDDASLDDYCMGGPIGGAYTVGTCIGPTFCCPATWKNTCLSCEGTCGASCGGSCVFSCRPDDACGL
jgi:hypothetical protein